MKATFTTSLSPRKLPTIGSNNPSTVASDAARVHAIIWRTAAVAWACLIFYLSTGGFGGGFTEALLQLILQSLHVTLTPHTFQRVHFLFRKLAHMTEYAIFAMLIYGSGREDDPFRWVPQRDVLQKPCRGGALLCLTNHG